MCGFAGTAFGKQRTLEKAAPLISYRGDIWGSWQDDRVNIVACRLARSGSRERPQPIVTNFGSCLAFNGELYNGDWISKKLSTRKSASTVDSELLALWLDVRGAPGIGDIEGEFSLAFFDARRSELVLARDNFGTRPLYWSRRGSEVQFGSSARATSFLRDGHISVDYQNASDALWYGVAGEGSCFEKVSCVEPGSSVICTPRKAHTIVRRAKKRPYGSEHLAFAIARRVPPEGAWLYWSGGTDSELIRYLWPESRPCKTAFVEGAPSNNLPRKADIALKVSEPVLRSTIGRFGNFAERPLTSLSGLALFALAREAKSNGAEISLSGEGADEIYFGYPYYFKSAKGHPLLLAKQGARGFVEGMLGLRREVGPSGRIDALITSPSKIDWLRFDRQTRLPEHLLQLNSDLPNMLAGIESRTPYLDLCHLASEEEVPASPKAQLIGLLESLGGKPKPKSGIFFPPDLLGKTWFDRAAKKLEVDCFSFINLPQDFAHRLGTALEKIAVLPLANDTIKNLENLIYAFVVGLWTFSETAHTQLHSWPDYRHRYTLVKIIENSINAAEMGY